MRIPLDYYRILGVPLEATDGQLSQAYRDRSLQLPGQEYSEQALDARKQLLELAYKVLSNPETRAAYNEQLSQWATPPSEVEDTDALPSLEIPQEQLMGALLILQELGEYELIIKLAHPYLDSKEEENRGILKQDLVVTIALTCLELGREQWQQGQYENAAASGETGQDLLLRFGLFPGLRREIQADLYKLRPYRILELLALPLEQVDRRAKGLQLLRDMLQERSGIDGQGNDQSGLNMDDFLRFIQQLRSYLTAAEQQGLFEAEARRPSAVATYLAVSALVGKGFAEKKPALIVRGKDMLVQLAQCQDVHLEQAICALLLGQTEEANKAVELSQEYEEVALIRKYSEGEPDLLPGLCFYGENWLEREVFSHFRDLQNNLVSLKEYFAEKQVQAYLEQLPREHDLGSSPWDVEAHSLGQRFAEVGANSSHSSANFEVQGSANLQEKDTDKEIVANSINPVGAHSNANLHSNASLSSELALSENKNTYTINVQSSRHESVNGMAGTRTTSTKPRPKPADTKTLQKETSFSPWLLIGQCWRRGKKASQNLRRKQHSSASVPSQVPQRKNKPRGMKVRRIKANIPSFKFILLLVPIFILVGGSFGFVVSKLFGEKDKKASQTLKEEQLSIQLNEPAVLIPLSPINHGIIELEPLNKEEAKKAVEGWLSAKSKAWGSRYETEPLKTVLAEPLLSQKLDSVEEFKENDSYWELEHEVTFLSMDNTGDDKATVIVKVREKANKYNKGQLSNADSYNSLLRIKYSLVRPNNQWLIQNQLEVKKL